ncbi:MAG: response regulator [Planctomycetes bacterium]|nr:response regulator [Planctomycetota bacterium]
MTIRDLRVLVAHHDPTVARRIAEEVGDAELRVAGPVGDLRHAIARAEGEMVGAVVLDLWLPDGGGPATFARFQERHPALPVVAMSPRREEQSAIEAVALGARCYLLDEELGRGLLAPVLGSISLSRGPGEAGESGAAAASMRHLLHDLGNLLAVASGGAELLVEKVGDDPLAEEVRELNTALTECVSLFRQVAASRRAGRSDG